jgi:hypothetical protein
VPKLVAIVLFDSGWMEVALKICGIEEGYERKKNENILGGGHVQE